MKILSFTIWWFDELSAKNRDIDEKAQLKLRRLKLRHFQRAR